MCLTVVFILLFFFYNSLSLVSLKNRILKNNSDGFLQLFFVYEFKKEKLLTNISE